MAACSATRCSVTRCSATRASGTVGQDPIRTARPPEPPPQVPRALPPRAAAASSPVGKPVRETGQVRSEERRVGKGCRWVGEGDRRKESNELTQEQKQSHQTPG